MRNMFVVSLRAAVMLAAGAGLLAWRHQVNQDAARTWNGWTPEQQRAAYDRDPEQTRRFMQERGVTLRAAG